MIEVELGCTSALKAAAWLKSDLRVHAVLRPLQDATAPPRGPVLRLEAASAAFGALTLLWGNELPASDDALFREAALGRSRAVWSDGLVYDTWRATARPLPARPLKGKPDPARPWLLFERAHAPPAMAQLVQPASLSPPQAHLWLRSREHWRPGFDSVVWQSTRKTLRSLLGHVDGVVASNGPLAWDATRLGLPVVELAGVGPPPELAAMRLARIVPASLVGDRRFWRRIVSDLVLERGAGSWSTSEWLRQARERFDVSGQTPGERWLRQLARRVSY